MSYAFFPGCSMEGTAHDYQSSTLAISQTLGLQMPEVPGWTCCGSTAAHQTDPLLALALPAKNLLAAAGATRMTRSASGDKTTASVTDKHGGVSMIMWSNSSRQRVM